MDILKLKLPMLLLSFFQSCGQVGNHEHQKLEQMEYHKIENLKARAAIEAWQEGDSSAWLSHFTEDAILLDDGRPRDFKKFSTETIGHEYFISIDKVESNGLEIYGEFHSDSWGDFDTYFKFRYNGEGKFYQLEIGQADY